jgi:hypothetical protein
VLAPQRRQLAVSVLALFACGIAQPGVAQQPVERAADYASVVLTGKLRDAGKTPFRLEIDCIALRESKGASREYLGTDGETPRCVLGTLSLALGGKEVRFPKVGVEDLGNIAIPQGVYLTSRADTVVLHVRGGDGAGAYKARFLIDGYRVTAREIERLDREGNPQVRRQDLSRR